MTRSITLMCLLLLCWNTAVFAQEKFSRDETRQLEEAEYLFDINDFLNARSIYERVLQNHPDDPELNYRMGICCFQLPAYELQALPYFEKASAAEFREAYFYLGKCYHLEERFDEAISTFERYKKNWQEKAVPMEEVDRAIATAKTAQTLIEQAVEFGIENLGEQINSPYPEYAPLVDVEGKMLIFTSRREGSTGGEKDPLGEYFEDIYISYKTEDGWGPAQPIDPVINTPTHDASVGLTPDGTQLIIYRTNKRLTAGDLYITTLSGDKWSLPELLGDAINTRNYQESGAAFSADTRVTYFSSNRPGGYGGKDLYRIVQFPDGEWSLPQNLGPTVNTPYDEEGPFFHPDGKSLYFSSTGHNSMGGFDLFRTMRTSDTSWTKPVNLGYPINSVSDDIYFSLSGDGQTGYFSSGSKGGYGDQDIFAVHFASQKFNLGIVKGIVKDIQTGEPLFADMSLFNEENGELEGIYASNAETGKFLLILTPGVKYTLEIEALDYQLETVELFHQGGDGLIEIPKEFVLKKP